MGPFWEGGPSMKLEPSTKPKFLEPPHARLLHSIKILLNLIFKMNNCDQNLEKMRHLMHKVNLL
jgi:hypothetical protein